MPEPIPEYFAKSTCSYFGEMGRVWIQQLPLLVARYAREWDLTVHGPFEGLSFNYVLPVTRSDGSSAVLKIGLPEPEQRSEIQALRHYDGQGIARILEFDLDNYIALIERIVPGTMLAEYFPQDDELATRIAAAVLSDLKTPAPNPAHDFGAVERWARRGMQGLRSEFDGGTGPFPERIVERAERLFDELISSTASTYLLHGDFHHMNVIFSEERGWLAIDPKGVVGDIAFECAAFILNPIPAIHHVPDVQKILARRIDELAEMLGLDRQRIHGWAQAFAVLSAWWSYDEIGSWKPTIALADRLASLRIR